MSKPNKQAPVPAGIMTREKLAVLHVAKKQLGLSDEDYQSLLGDFGGVTSAKDLDEHGFEAVIFRFTQLGFISTWNRRNLGYRTGMATPRQIGMIRALWDRFTDGQGNDASLGRWLEGRFKVSALRFLNRETAHKVCGALKRMTDKQAAKAQKGGNS